MNKLSRSVLSFIALIALTACQTLTPESDETVRSLRVFDFFDKNGNFIFDPKVDYALVKVPHSLTVKPSWEGDYVEETLNVATGDDGWAEFQMPYPYEGTLKTQSIMSTTIDGKIIDICNASPEVPVKDSNPNGKTQVEFKWQECGNSIQARK